MIGGLIAIGTWSTFISISGKEQADENIERLKWMKNHHYKFQKSQEEKEKIQQSLDIQQKYKRKIFNMTFTPQVDWGELPMDEDFLNKFN